jgi:hypothetical protein
MSFRAPGEYITISFDAAGRIVERGVRYGLFRQVASDLQDAAHAGRDPYELGGALITVPSLFPNELSEVVRDALVLRLPPAVGKLLRPHETAAWCRR